MQRFFLAILLFVLLAPLPGSQIKPGPPSVSERVAAVPLPKVRPGERFGALIFAEGWTIYGQHHKFGGHSALAVTDTRKFLMLSDIGYRLHFAMAPDGTVRESRFAMLPPPRAGYAGKLHYDAEGIAIDPASGHYWSAMEGTGEIWSFASDDRRLLRTRQRVLESWPDNGGVEGFARLTDGRFLALSESRTRLGQREGLIFSGNPGDPATPLTRIFYETGGQGDVTAVAALPDGRIIIVHRRLWLNPVFRTSIAIADPRTIAAGQTLTSRPIALIDDGRIAENYEGAAVSEGPDGLSLWLVSDDNLQDWQSTRLVRFIIDADALMPTKRAAPSPARP